LIYYQVVSDLTEEISGERIKAGASNGHYFVVVKVIDCNHNVLLDGRRQV
jgi:hypothetical protein